MVKAALKIAREDLLAAGNAYYEAKERGADVRRRQIEAQRALGVSDKKRAEAHRAANTAFDDHVAGEITADQFAKRFKDVEKAEAELRAANDLVQRWEGVTQKGLALDARRRDLDGAREVYAQAAVLAEIGIDDLRERLIRSFVLWSWGRGYPVEGMGSERGDLFLRFLPELFDPANRDEVNRARDAVEPYFTELPEELQ